MLPLALEARRKGKFEALCDKEDNFPQLHAALGSEVVQEAVRQSNPDGKHCELLRRNPSACKQCHLNPYNGDEGRDGELYRTLEQYGHWLEDAVQLDDYHRLGLGPSPQDLSPAEFETLRITYRDEQLIQSQLQGQEIARILSKLLAKPE